MRLPLVWARASTAPALGLPVRGDSPAMLLASLLALVVAADGLPAVFALTVGVCSAAGASLHGCEWLAAVGAELDVAVGERDADEIGGDGAEERLGYDEVFYRLSYLGETVRNAGETGDRFMRTAGRDRIG